MFDDGARPERKATIFVVIPGQPSEAKIFMENAAIRGNA
jgi:hypothetical protein